MILLLALTAWSVEAPDRSAAPEVVPAEALAHPAMQHGSPRPGLDVVLVPTPGMRKTRISLIFRRGSRQLDPVGSASYDAFGWVWDQATRRRSGEALSIFEDVHDVDVWSTSAFESTTVHLDAPLEELDAGLELLREVVVEPRFVRKDLRLIREARTRFYLREAPTDGGALLEGALDHLWVPEDHPLDPRPDVVGWRDLRVSDVKAHHAELLASAPLTLVVVGDLSMDEVQERIVPVADGLGVPGELTAPIPFTAPTKTQVLAVDLGGTGRATLGLRMAAPVRGDADVQAFRLIDHAMGGHFLARLNEDLRETRGLTYGIESSYSSGRSVGTWTLSTEVSIEDAEEAIGAIQDQLETLAAGGLSETELADGVQARISGWNGTFTTVERAARVYSARVRLGMSVQEARAQLDSYGAVSVEDSKQVAARWVADAPQAWILVGERSELDPQLENLGMEVQWLPGELVILGGGVGPNEE